MVFKILVRMLTQGEIDRLEREKAGLEARLEIAETALRESSGKHRESLEGDRGHYRPVRLRRGDED